MRSLDEKTKKLTLNDNNCNINTNNNHTSHNNRINNNNSNNTTKTTSTNLPATQVISSSDFHQKNSKMQQLSTTTTTTKTAGVKKQQSQQMQQQLNNNHTGSTITLPKASHANTNEEIAGGVQDTIYLCNFRVSVDGEWLCLKELHDLDIGQQQQHRTLSSKASSFGGGQQQHYQTSQHRYAMLKNKKFSSLPAEGGFDDNNGILDIQNLFGRRLYGEGPQTANNTKRQHMLMRNAHHVGHSGLMGDVAGGGDWENLPRDPAEIERSNLVNICKLVVKELLEQSLRYGRMLDSDHLPLQHFFIVIEHVLGHGLRPKKGLLGPRKELWDLLQSVENYCPEAQDITASVRDLPTVRTHIGRARAWLRIALMQKKLSDYLQALIEHREDSLYEYYEPHALMMSDEIVIIMGILVGLNVIDCNLCVKQEDLDSQQGVIDFSLYLRSSSRNNDSTDAEETQGNNVNGQGNMIAVLDQKNYIEELNRHLNATVGNLQAKVESLTTTNALMKEDLAIARNSLLALQAENQAMRQHNNSAATNHLANAASLQSVHSDHSSNSSTEKVTIESVTAELAEEKKRNAELTKELSLQISLKAESDMAMKLLEKDIHEKQDTIISLRRQLDDIKQINLEMYRKLQECEIQLKHKSDLLSKLETQKEDMSQIIAQLEQKWCTDKSNMGEILKTSHDLSKQVTASEERAARAEAECRIERDWRMSLLEREVKLKENISSLQGYVKELTDDLKRNDKLKDELINVRTQWSEAQTTLEELGIQLSVSKLKVSELEERERQHHQRMSSSSTSSVQVPAETVVSAGIWAPDSIASHCTSCQKEFNLTRRRHHCRSCGEIFCNNCSEQVLPLLNESGQVTKPVRVCESCFAAKK